MWQCAGLREGQCGQSVAASLTLLMLALSVSVIRRDASASPLGSGIFTKVPCLWIVSSWSFCERDGRWQSLSHHIGDITSHITIVL